MQKRTHYLGLALGAACLLHTSLLGQNPGALDLEFSFGAAPNDEVTSLAVDAEGRILMTGWFTNVGNHIARRHPTGEHDGTFNSGSGADSLIQTATVLDDGTIMIGGYFSQYDGQNRPGIARLLPDGAVDTTFDPGAGFNDNVVRILPVAGGKYVVAGWFNQVQGADIQGLARLNANGTLDTSFGIGGGADRVVADALVLADGRIVAGGNFTTFNGESRNRLVFLNADGSFDTSSNIGTGFNGPVTALLEAPDGKILVAGSFSSYNGVSRSRLVRLHPNGALDQEFDAGLGPNGAVNSMDVDSAGRTLIGGNFTTYDGTSRARIARLRATGGLDSTFNPGSGADAGINSVIDLGAADRILIGGRFTSYDGEAVGRIARLIGGDATGGYATWLAEFFAPAELGDPAITAPEADPDNDGIANLLEYAFFSHPLESSRQDLPSWSIEHVGGQPHLAITFVRVRDALDIVYNVESSTDLVNWTGIWSSIDAPYEGETEAALETVADDEVMTASSKRFLRVNVTLEEN